MSRSFDSIDAFLAHLATLPRAVREAERHGAEVAGAELEQHAKALLGTYDAVPPWARLKDATIARKARGDTPLLETGDLRDSIGHQADEHGVTLGSTSPIAPYQEHGTARGIPPRPFITATLFQRGHAAADTIARHVVAVLAGMPAPPRWRGE